MLSFLFSERESQLGAKFYASPEGRIFLLGLGISLSFIVLVALCSLWDPELTQILTGLTATLVLFGRAAGLSFGYAVGCDHTLLISVSMVVETAIVLLFYPLFVLSMQQLIRIPALDKINKRIEQVASRHHDKMRRYGLIGLLFFVWFPFWMTGPIVGVAIGYFLRLRAWVNMSVVLLGTYLAILSWAFILRALHDKVAYYNPYAPMMMVLILIGVVILGYFLRNKHWSRGRARK